MSNLEKTFQDFNNSLDKTVPQIPGELGISINGQRLTEVPNRGQYVYVRLRSNLSEVVQAFNDKVFPGYNLPVLVQWNNNRYEVTGRDTQRYPEWAADNPYLARHGDTHSMNKEAGKLGTDPVWVYPYQFMPSLVSPFNVVAENVYIHPYTVNYGNTWKSWGNTGTASLVQYAPVSGSAVVLITIDGNTGNPYLFASTGTYIPTNISGTASFVPYLPTVDTGQYIPLTFARVDSNTTSMGWSNLYDVRQFVHAQEGGGGGLTNPVEYIDFDTAGTATPNVEGRLSWNPDDGTLEIGLPGGNVVNQIGQEINVPRRVKNDTGNPTIYNGQLLYISGGDGNNAFVKLADYSSESKSARTLAMATETFNNYGYATEFGLVRDVDTSAYPVGTSLYLGYSGSFIGTKPYAPFHYVPVGTVFRQHATEGAILVNIQNGNELAELHDVRITGTPQNLDILVFDTASGTWSNRPPQIVDYSNMFLLMGG